MNDANKEKITLGVINVSDRASAGEYEDLPGKEAVEWMREQYGEDWELEYAVVPDDEDKISDTLRYMADNEHCLLILTTGGTGPAPRDVTPEATTKVCERMLPGFSEQMRMGSLKYVPTAILSRQVAGTRGRSLIINLPGKLKSIRECLNIVKDAIPYCVFLVSGVDLCGKFDEDDD